MKLRSILRALSLLAFISACAAGYLYYHFLKEYASQEAERHVAEGALVLLERLGGGQGGGGWSRWPTP